MKGTLAVGLMSGSSLDGVDAALVRIDEGIADKLSFKLIDFYSLPFNEIVRGIILNILPPRTGSVSSLSYLNYYLGEIFAEATLEVIRKSGRKPEEVRFIASHGLTVCNLTRQDEYHPRARMQIGELAVIAERTGITTVGDFRPGDVAAGGEGAPLIPFFDYHAFSVNGKNRLVVNIGGIANVTYLPASGKMEKVKAFDTGPGNILLDAYIRYLTRGEQKFDVNGERSLKGRINGNLLEWLLQHPFIYTNPPKSAGREEFGEAFFKNIIDKANEFDMNDNDICATLSAFTVDAISKNVDKYLGPIDEVIVGGGGAYNKAIMMRFKENFKGVSVLKSDDLGVPVKAKEAIGFALMGFQTLRKKPNNIHFATGATHPVVMGKIVWGRFGI